ncbi:MAG: hypothetical protein ACTH5C_12750, partial [Pseudoalteromonas prydzensis]
GREYFLDYKLIKVCSRPGIVMVRNRINLIAGSNKGDNLWLNPFITSIFHVIYMQHKINQGLAKKVI